MLKITAAIPTPIGPMVEQISGMFGQLGTKQEVAMEFKTGASLKEIFDEDSEPLINHLMKGFSFTVRNRMWSEFSKILSSVLAAPEMMGNQLGMAVMGTLPAYALTFKGDFEMDADHAAVKSLIDSPLGAPA